MNHKQPTRLFDDTTPQAEAKLIELLRQKNSVEKLRMVNQLNAGLRTVAMSGLRLRFPNATDEELKRKLAEIRLGSELAQRVYGKALRAEKPNE
jgi:ABC-type transport system involved in cytochrome bd biosynthesis fused ATPase/permease subunit